MIKISKEVGFLSFSLFVSFFVYYKEIKKSIDVFDFYF